MVNSLEVKSSTDGKDVLLISTARRGPYVTLSQQCMYEIDPVCRCCNLAIENFTHLLWHCTLSNTCWDFFSKWLGFEVKRLQLLGEIISAFFKRNGHNRLLILFSATIWSIWLTRNAKAFRNTNTSQAIPEKIILHRAWSQSISNGLILEKWFNLWVCILLEACAHHRQDELRTTLTHRFNHYSLVGFTDGAYNKSIYNISRSRMGGLLQTKTTKHIIYPQGPFKALMHYKWSKMLFNFFLRKF